MLFAIMAGVYLLGLPILLWGVSLLHKQMFIVRPQRRAVMKKRKLDESKLPKPLLGRLNQYLKFAVKDKRILDFTPKKKREEGAPPKSKLQRRGMWFALYIGGLGFALASAIGESVNFTLFAVAVLFYISSIVFTVISSSPLLAARRKNLAKMYEIAQPHLGLDRSEPMEKLVKITEWRDEYIPMRAEIYIPTNFAASGEEGFMRQFNQVFGRVSAWVADSDAEKRIEGWDYENSLLKLRAVPPLPMRADWDEKYINHPGIAWSFFPLALGVENGVAITDEKTGAIEYVLGLDLSGHQPKVGEAAGLIVSKKITKTPQVLIGGGTGGGKALASSTPVLRRVRPVLEDADYALAAV